MSGEEKQKSIAESISSASSGMSHGIPDALSFNRIIEGGTCPVSLATVLASCYDFYWLDDILTQDTLAVYCSRFLELSEVC